MSIWDGLGPENVGSWNLVLGPEEIRVEVLGQDAGERAREKQRPCAGRERAREKPRPRARSRVRLREKRAGGGGALDPHQCRWKPFVSPQWRFRRFLKPRCERRHRFVREKRFLHFSLSLFINSIATSAK